MLALIIDAHHSRRQALAGALAGVRCEVREVMALELLPLLPEHLRPALVVAAFGGDRADAAFAAIEQLRKITDTSHIILIVERGSEALAVRALRVGVYDYFSEPIAVADVAASARRCLFGPDTVPSASGSRLSAAPLIGADPAIRQISQYLADVARHDSTVLITGETGTGKELAAAMIHGLSPRRHARLVSVNCAAIPETLLESELFGHESGAFTGATGRRDGLLQLADRGTAFLDEVGEMSAAGQAKILRALETRELCRVGGKRPVRVDVRIVAATNQDLERAVDEGRFRKDLYFRLNVARVHLPPLRERRGDIRVLLDHYLQKLNRQRGASISGFAPETCEALERYDWPGNVRELKNLVEAVFIAPQGKEVKLADLPAPFRAKLEAMDLSSDAERRQLLDALLAANWNKSHAAKMLHWSRMTLYRKMTKYSVVRSTDRCVPRAR